MQVIRARLLLSLWGSTHREVEVFAKYLIRTYYSVSPLSDCFNGQSLTASVPRTLRLHALTFNDFWIILLTPLSLVQNCRSSTPPPTANTIIDPCWRSPARINQLRSGLSKPRRPTFRCFLGHLRYLLFDDPGECRESAQGYETAIACRQWVF